MRPALFARARRALLALGVSCGVALAPLTLIEGGLRLFDGGPHGYFRGWFRGGHGLYPEGATLELTGAFSWTVRTNSLGMRAPDLSPHAAPGVTRIAMIGDSITDGLYVDNDDTFPSRTAQTLTRLGARAEVANAGYTGMSIDKELAVLREIVIGLNPDVVVLTFVTNDVEALDGIGDVDLLSRRLQEKSWRQSILSVLTQRSALGEWLFDRYLHLRSPIYKTPPARRDFHGPPVEENRRVPDGESFAANSRLFLDRFTEEGELLREHLGPKQEQLVDRYLKAFDAFVTLARAHGMKPVLAYFPPYPQVYDQTSPDTLPLRLSRHCQQRGVPFLDLTRALRSGGGTPLHFAPVDFHLNPEGNRVIGAALADFLIAQGLVPVESTDAQ